ncbi:MAG: TldD/PmbA family protein [Candidatus Eisenbacteria bacterium]|nr:TldD/PmbA family protein [Candidatus Eisenbacteria bacterium]
MIPEKELLSLLTDALEKSPADGTELMAYGVDSSLTRFADSGIHQNVHENDHSVVARVAVGKRIGVTETNKLAPASISKAIERAVAMAKESPEEEDFPGFPETEQAPEVPSYDQATAEATPDRRAEGVATAARIAGEKNLKVSGAFRTSNASVAVVSTAGTRQHYDATDAFLSVLAIGDGGESGSQEGYAVSVDDIDIEGVTRSAVDKCVAAKNPVDLAPGEFDVILEPRATAEIMSWLSFTAFGAKEVQEGRSFMAGRIGEKVMHDSITIYDDGRDPEGVPIPFDFEGVPKKRVVMIENGVARGPVYDSLTAARDGVESTGHAGVATFRGGPGPSNLFIAAGEDDMEALLSRVKRGLLVTRFHYLNGLLDTKRALFTGMTRDGTFLIENGKMTNSVKNLRFTDSMLRAYSNVDGVTKDRQSVGGNWGGIGSVTVPAVLVRDFKFTGATEF